MSEAWILASTGPNLLTTPLTNPNYLDSLLSEPTSPEIFLDWLRKGLGRASLHLEKHASTPYIDTIAYACTTSLVYNMQAESSRAFYLLPLMRKSGHFENLADAVLAAYESNTGTDQDMYQKSVLVSLLAAESYPGCKEALFTHISAPPEGSGDRFGSIYEVIDLDRPRAIDIFVNRAFGIEDTEERLKTFHELVTDISLLDRDDQRSILPPADQLFPDHPQAWPIVTSVLKDLAEQQYTTTAKPMSLPTYENVLYRIMNAPARSDFYALASFARKMTPADAKLLGTDFVEETDPEIVWRFIAAFSRVRCPAGFRKILSYLDVQDERKRGLAVDALSNFRHPKIRKLAIDLGKNGNAKEAVRLLKANYKPEDVPFLTWALSPESGYDQDIVHSIGWALLKLAEKWPDPSLQPSLLMLYERTPCSGCRDNAAQLLFERDSLTCWVYDEEPFDTIVLGELADTEPHFKEWHRRSTSESP